MANTIYTVTLANMTASFATYGPGYNFQFLFTTPDDGNTYVLRDLLLSASNGHLSTELDSQLVTPTAGIAAVDPGDLDTYVYCPLAWNPSTPPGQRWTANWKGHQVLLPGDRLYFGDYLFNSSTSFYPVLLRATGWRLVPR